MKTKLYRNKLGIFLFSPPRELFPVTNYDIIADFLNLAYCTEHFISIKHRILVTFNINKKFNSDNLYAFNCCRNYYLMTESLASSVGGIAINT
jgi:hypothetical protein